MNRRTFSIACLGAMAALAAPATRAFSAQPNSDVQQPASQQTGRTPGKPHIAFLLYEGMTALDLIGPVEVLAGAEFSVDFVAADRNPVFAENRSDKRLGLVPTATYADISNTDIICVPGTSNPYVQIAMRDMIEWVATVGSKAQWVTSVCSGSFILGAAGLLKGYKATSHWSLAPQLAYFGAVPVAERVVHDRNRVTGAGVTSGIDFGLTLLSLLCNTQTAMAKQLVLEYDPHPPFNCGSPKVAEPALVKTVQEQYGSYLKQVAPNATRLLEEHAARLGVTPPAAS
ncbi:MAG: DJ-1/PfpI family protein [Halodesulfovibrio sp.]